MGFGAVISRGHPAKRAGGACLLNNLTVAVRTRDAIPARGIEPQGTATILFDGTTAAIPFGRHAVGATCVVAKWTGANFLDRLHRLLRQGPRGK